MNTAIGAVVEVVEKKKLSLLDERGIVQNIQTQCSNKVIGPDKLKGVDWFHQAFLQPEVPKNKRGLFDIPKPDSIDLLVGQKGAGLLTQRIKAQE